ncbi:Magnesium chelatase, subunit ChlI [Parelaphostrongylus tenuis]|uniref:DNA replication licensing factor MCM7 n=1 Tax=Parelaphostrongylus tenuis TaxID=148309 RepID=A0AAD5M7X3_PARTN|nr:Magnesium chelatase, subunit ChlI [Parelaphostrongylus tenuis]
MAFNKEEIDYDKYKSSVRDFLDAYYGVDEAGAKVFYYREDVQRIAEREQIALYVNLDDVARFDEGLATSIEGNAKRFHHIFNEVVDEMVHEVLGNRQPPIRDALDAFIFQRVHMDDQSRISEGYLGGSNQEVRKKYPPQLLRRFEVIFKSREVTKPLAVRDLKAKYVGKLVTVTGVVIRATEVKPILEVMTYACDTCGAEVYQPVTGPSFMPATNCPSKDCVESRANGRLHMQVRGSKFSKFQEIKIQELSDQVPVGSIPRTLTVNIYGESTRQCGPGDLVQISGILIPFMKTGFRQGGGLLAETFLEAHSVENIRCSIDDKYAEEDLTEEEVDLLAQDNLYDMLAYSIAPEIYGLTDVKKSLLLALVGGVDRNASGMKIRGCLNVLLMGDPGVAKSQLLSYVNRLASRSQCTTGRGSSGVGLTAAVVKDPLTGELILEGGALVLADRGICCIDEFDKMMESDRTSIHEVMEQQTISIAKAGIMTTLNARVAIIAAANPAFGRYNPKRSIEQNIDLPAALLSRFDLLWLIQDRPDRDGDRRLASHITHVHMNSKQPEVEGMKPIDMRLVRRLIEVAQRKQPVVGDALRERLVEMYVDMRRNSRESDDSTFTSPRLLLSVIRMSTALARLRLSNVVSPDDIEEAIRLMQASKDSLRPEIHQQEIRHSPVDQAFAVLRELNISSGERPIPFKTALESCTRKGISEQALRDAIVVHETNGVIMVDPQQRIRFVMN